MTNAEKLKHYRAEHNLSQNQFAKAHDIDVRTLQHWEQGRNQGSLALKMLIAKISKSESLKLS